MKRKHLNQIKRGLDIISKSRKDAFLMNRATDKQKARAFDALMSVLNQDIVNGKLGLEQSYEDYEGMPRHTFDALMSSIQKKVDIHEKLINLGRAFLALAENNVSRETSDAMYNDIIAQYIVNSGDLNSPVKDLYFWYRSIRSPVGLGDKFSGKDDSCRGKEENACRWCREQCGEFGD